MRRSVATADELPGWHFGSWSNRLMPAGRIVRIPADVRRKQTMLEHIAYGFGFPADFPWHWDAAGELLSDLHWLPKPVQGAIVHADIPFLKHSAQRPVYLQMLAEATRCWAERGDGELVVVFPKADEAEVREFLYA